ncbi:MAG: polysaccharide pyruvyl transferase family protein [Planctomycetota bacterium]
MVDAIRKRFNVNTVLKSLLRPPYRLAKKLIQSWRIKVDSDRLLRVPNDVGRPKIFYLGVTEHSNLGDLAQHYCIKRWLAENYPLRDVHEFEATTVVDTRFNFLERMERVLNPNDLIFFQSGYTTQDLGGNHELMHRMVIDRFPNAKTVLMPQTVFFKSEERKQLTARCYNQNPNLIFLARDRVSYDLACDMFPDVTVWQYPDIVTSLIGHCDYRCDRNGVLFCCRNDSEKHYPDDEINRLRERVASLSSTDMIDTTIRKNYKAIRRRLDHFIKDEIQLFARYELVITDRYHGTIFSLVANTPVIVIKTNDHKVTTGVEWFHGVYDDRVFLAESLEHAYELANRVLKGKHTYRLKPYFEKEYYGRLRDAIADIHDRGEA